MKKNYCQSGKVIPRVSNHARLRKQQRGISEEAINIVFLHGDREIDAGSNCYKLCLSKRRLSDLVYNKTVTPKQAEKCQKLVLLTDGDIVITTYRSKSVH